MKRPSQITFHGVDAGEELRALIEEKIARLETLHDGLLGVRVAVERPHQHQRLGRLYVVRVELTLPGRELVVAREQGDAESHENALIAVRDAFRAAERQLRDFVEARRALARGEQARPAAGQVVRLFPYEGYGFLLSGDGREIYFERGAVLHDEFERLRVGQVVHYAESEGVAGPRASTVDPRTHHVGH